MKLIVPLCAAVIGYTLGRAAYNLYVERLLMAAQDVVTFQDQVSGSLGRRIQALSVAADNLADN